MVTDEPPLLAEVPVAWRASGVADRLRPPAEQPAAVREAIYHMPAFTAGRIPTAASGALWWASCGEHVWGVISCGPHAPAPASSKPPPTPRVTGRGCGYLQLAWERTAGAEGREELEYRVYFLLYSDYAEDTAAPMDLAGTTVRTEFDLIGLAAAQRYAVRLAVSRGGMWSGLSEPLVVTTLFASQADRHAPALLQLHPVRAVYAHGSWAAHASSGGDAERCHRLGPVEVGALPDCHGTDFQSLEISEAEISNAAGGGDWSAWRVVVPRLTERRADIAVSDARRAYRLRVTLHAEVSVSGLPSPPMLVDGPASVLGSEVWPALTPRPMPGTTSAPSAATFVPRVRPLGSAGFAVAMPSPLSPCQADVKWRLLWHEPRVAPIEDEGEHQGSVALERTSSDMLVAPSLRCPRQCTFRLVPATLAGWTTPSAETPPIGSPPLHHVMQHPAVVLEIRLTHVGSSAPPMAEGGISSSAAPSTHERELESLLRAELGLAGDSSSASALRLLEARLDGEFLTFEVASSHAHVVVSKLLAFLSGESDVDGSPPSSIAARLDRHAGLLQIRDDGSAVLCTSAAAFYVPQGSSAALVAACAILVAAALAYYLRAQLTQAATNCAPYHRSLGAEKEPLSSSVMDHACDEEEQDGDYDEGDVGNGSEDEEDEQCRQ